VTNTLSGLKCLYSGRVPIAMACVLFCAAGLMPLRAQEGGATLTGTILYQAGKTVSGATVIVKNDSNSVSALSRTTESDASGHFSATGLPAGAYNVEATAPGFARNTRIGVQLSATGTEDVSITLFVDSVSQSVTIQESVSLATELARPATRWRRLPPGRRSAAPSSGTLWPRPRISPRS